MRDGRRLFALLRLFGEEGELPRRDGPGGQERPGRRLELLRGDQAVHDLGSRRTFFLANFWKFLAASFSAVSKRNVARKYAFDCIFQILHNLYTFAPLQSQNFSKRSV